MCSKHKLAVLLLIRILQAFRLTWQLLLCNEVSKGYLSSHMSPEGVDTFSCLKNTEY